jgi:hypothetical protein
MHHLEIGVALKKEVVALHYIAIPTVHTCVRVPISPSFELLCGLVLT